MHFVADTILKLHGIAALAIVFALPALEASVFVGVVFPGEIAVLLGGVLANQGRVSLVAVYVVAIAGAIIGDSIGFEVGKHYGERVLRAIPDRLVKPEHIDRGKDAIRRLGGKSVFVGRFTAALRALVPGLAGMSGMSYPRFLAWNAIGGALWAGGYVTLGYLVGSQYQRVERAGSAVGWTILGLIVLFFLGRWLWRRHRERSEAGAAS